MILVTIDAIQVAGWISSYVSTIKINFWACFRTSINFAYCARLIWWLTTIIISFCWYFSLREQFNCAWFSPITTTYWLFTHIDASPNPFVSFITIYPHTSFTNTSLSMWLSLTTTITAWFFVVFLPYNFIWWIVAFLFGIVCFKFLLVNAYWCW